jgi:hypothetical protein
MPAQCPNKLDNLSSCDRRQDVRVPKISTFEQQRFTGDLCKRVGEAIAEI